MFYFTELFIDFQLLESVTYLDQGKWASGTIHRGALLKFQRGLDCDSVHSIIKRRVFLGTAQRPLILLFPHSGILNENVGKFKKNNIDWNNMRGCQLEEDVDMSVAGCSANYDGTDGLLKTRRSVLPAILRRQKGFYF